MPTDIRTLIPTRPSAFRRLRRTLFFALALIALLAAGWSALWHVAAGKLDDAVKAALEREARAGRSLSCGSRVIAGFPFALTMVCDKPRLEIARPAGKTAFSGQSLTVSTGVTSLGHVMLKAEGPLAIEAPGISDAEAQWRALTAEIVVGLRGFDHADLAVEAPSLHLRNGQNMITSNADQLALHGEPDKGRPEADEAIVVTGKLSRLVSPVLDALTGETAAADGDLEVSVSKAVVALRPGTEEPPQPALERWRAAGGSAHIVRAVFTKGQIKLAVTGDLGIDAAHRLSGRVDAAVEGADVLAQRLQIPKIGVNIARMSGGRLSVPVELADGRVIATLGPIAVALPVALLPLY